MQKRPFTSAVAEFLERVNPHILHEFENVLAHQDSNGEVEKFLKKLVEVKMFEEKQLNIFCGEKMKRKGCNLKTIIKNIEKENEKEEEEQNPESQVEDNSFKIKKQINMITDSLALKVKLNIEHVEKKNYEAKQKSKDAESEPQGQVEEDILKKYIKGKDISQELTDLQFRQDLEKLKKLYEDLQEPKIQQNLVKLILHDGNYNHLIPKSNTSNSNRVIELLSKVDEECKGMAGKNIICLYGDTGTGKSCLTNYLKRIPMKKFLDKYGRWSVQEDKQADTYDPLCVQSKISHSKAVSETLYSKGFSVNPNLINEGEQYLHNTMICDNPGLKQTRGSDFALCTYLSMDRAVEVSKNISSIVLVIPYDSFFDRNSRVPELMQQIIGIFPDILNPKSATFQRFFIALSKAPERAKLSNIRRILFDNIRDLSNKQRELTKRSKGGKNFGSIKELDERIQIFQCLSSMRADHIDIIDVEDFYGAIDLMEKYGNTTKPIPTGGYNKTLQNGESLKEFIKNISTTVHNWNQFIFKCFLLDKPQAIWQKIEQIQKKEQQKKKKSQNIEEEKEQIKRLQQQIQDHQKQLKKEGQQVTRVVSEEWTNEQLEQIRNFGASVPKVNYIKVYDDRIKDVDRKIDRLQTEQQGIMAFKEDLLKNKNIVNDQIMRLQKIVSDHKIKISQFKAKDHTDVLVNMETSYYEKIPFGAGISQQEQRRTVRSHRTIDFKQEGYFYAGTQKKNLCCIHHVQREYSLVPNSGFDTNQYISSVNSSYGKYKAVINSRYCTLKEACVTSDRKHIYLLVNYHYDITQYSSNLPMLKITHTIPYADIYADVIQNKLAEGSTVENSIRQYQRTVQVGEQRINQTEGIVQSKKREVQAAKQQKKQAQSEYQTELQRRNSVQKANSENQQKIIIQDKKKEKIKQRNLMIQDCLQKIQEANMHISQLITGIKKLDSEAKDFYLELQELLYQRQRYSFLIQDQLDKKVPQTLLSFIEVAKKILVNQIKNKKGDPTSKHIAKERIKTFSKFEKIYAKVGSDILGSLSIPESLSIEEAKAVDLKALKEQIEAMKSQSSENYEKEKVEEAQEHEEQEKKQVSFRKFDLEKEEESAPQTIEGEDELDSEAIRTDLEGEEAKQVSGDKEAEIENQKDEKLSLK